MNYSNNYSNIANMDREAYEQFLAEQCVNSVVAESPEPIKATVETLCKVCDKNISLVHNLASEIYGKDRSDSNTKYSNNENMRDALKYILDVCMQTNSMLTDITLNTTGELNRSEQ